MRRAPRQVCKTQHTEPNSLLGRSNQKTSVFFNPTIDTLAKHQLFAIAKKHTPNGQNEISKIVRQPSEEAVKRNGAMEKSFLHSLKLRLNAIDVTFDH